MHGRGMFSTQATATDCFPHGPLPPQQIRAILEAFRLAWAELMARPHPHGIDSPDDENEISISDALLSVMSTIHNSDPPPIPVFTRDFQTPISDQSLKNYDRSKIVTRVDFCFRPKVNPCPGRDPRYYGLFVEAKPIHGGSISNYVTKGLIKFQIGDYAWAMTQGMMVAYVHPTRREPLDALSQYFGRHGNAQKFGLRTSPNFWPKDRHIPRPCITKHARTWQYPPPDGRDPGDIDIIHLWLPMVQSP